MAKKNIVEYAREALFNRKKQLDEEEERQTGSASPPEKAASSAGGMSQAEFSGYGKKGRPPMSKKWIEK